MGEPESAALSHTVDRAVAAEKSGYRRFWVAEHHAVPGIASGSPPVLLAALGSRTTTIRIGSGGVMLPHHQPLVVAEQFLMLDALFPGRIDLGLGRSGRGLTVAARLGLPVVLGGPLLDSPDLDAALAGYRREFRPSPRACHPHVTLALEVTVAETDEQARALVLPEAWAMARSRSTGVFPPLEPVGDIASWTGQARRRVEAAVRRAIAGTPQTVRRRLEQLTDRTGAEELLATTSTYDRAALAASDAALARIVAG